PHSSPRAAPDGSARPGARSIRSTARGDRRTAPGRQLGHPRGVKSAVVRTGGQPRAGRVSAVSGATGIELTGLAKSFGEGRAVRGIDVAVAPGEPVALLGPNGAGKSTTIDMLLGLLEPDGGAVSVFGAPPRAAVDAGAVGAMLQTGALIRDVTVRELIAMMASLYPSPLDVDEVLRLVGISDIADRRTQKLSGGQTQRV